jgi:hypothetical protein
VPSHRRPPQRRLRAAHGSRRGPPRLTLAAAAATLAVAGGVSAGVAMAAGTPGEAPGAGTSHAAADRPAPRAISPASQEPDSASQKAADGRPAAVREAAPAARAAAPPRRQAAAPRSSPQSAAPAQPYLVYDSVLPAVLPAGHVIATYATGPYAVSATAVAGRGPVLWIDTIATDPAADVLDVEPGCASPSAAAGWASSRLGASPAALAIIYTSQAEWPAVQAAVAGLPAAMRSRIRWWIADPTGYAHLVPGSDATQWYWGSSYDISTATARFLTCPS